MRYNIHGRLIYDAMDGTLTLPGSDEADSQLSITANALLWFFLRHTEVVNRDICKLGASGGTGNRPRIGFDGDVVNHASHDAGQIAACGNKGVDATTLSLLLMCAS